MAQPSFQWKIASGSKAFTGEQKADLAERMQSIVEGFAPGQARLAFAYGEGFVSATISPIADQAMVERAKAKAIDSTTRGLKGLVSRFLMFWHRLDDDQRHELVERLSQSYLRDELALANADMQRRFIDLLRQSDALDDLVQTAR